MKKFIKKTLAGLIAGVMAVSSMPFAALTAYADDSYNTMPSTTFTAKTGTAKPNWEGDSTDKTCVGYYNNLLFASSMSSSFDDYICSTDTSYCQTRGFYPTMVLLYDGVNDSYAPIMGAAKKSDPLSWTARYLQYYVPMDSNNTSDLQDSSNFYADRWLGSDSSSTLDFTKTILSTHHSVNSSVENNIVNFGLTKGTYYPHSSKLHVKDSITFEANDGYSHSQNIYWFAGSHTNAGKAASDCDKAISQANKTTYVVNYKPLYDAATEAANALKTFDQNKYTVASVNAYYDAINDLYNFDPNTYFNSISESDVSTKVDECAKEIKSKVDSYNSAKAGLTLLKTYTYSFVNADGTTVNTVEATSVEEALKSAPTNTATKYDYVDNTKHKTTTYAWQEASEVTDTTINEVESVVEEAHTIDANTHQCTLCEGYALDTSAYETALDEVKAIAKNEDKKYTDDSINALNQVIASVEEERTKVTTQEQLDTLTKILRESVYDLAIAKNKVTFYTVAAGSSVPTQVELKTLDYGTTYTANANANVKQWTVTTDESHTSTKLNTFDSSVNVIVTKDVSIYAYLSDEDTAATSSKVTFLGKNNQVVAIKYVAQGEELKTNTVDIPEIPFYSAGSWSEETITGDGNEYTVKASYTYLLGATTCQVNLVENGEITWKKDYSYDSYVYLSKADKSKKYALYSDEACTKLLTYIDGVDFYAPKTAAVYVKEYTEDAQPTVAVTGSFSTSTSTKKYANFNCKFFLPADATAVEWGLEVKIGDGVFAKVKAESKSERNEYTVKLGTGIDSGTNSIEGRAYLVYEYNGVTYTINSGDLTTVTLS